MRLVNVDTAPTGHTLRFLSFPTTLDNALGKLSGLSASLKPMMGMMGQDGDVFGKMEGMREIVQKVNKQFQDPVTLHLFRN